MLFLITGIANFDQLSSALIYTSTRKSLPQPSSFYDQPLPWPTNFSNTKMDVDAQPMGNMDDGFGESWFSFPFLHFFVNFVGTKVKKEIMRRKWPWMGQGKEGTSPAPLLTWIPLPPLLGWSWSRSFPPPIPITNSSYVPLSRWVNKTPHKGVDPVIEGKWWPKMAKYEWMKSMHIHCRGGTKKQNPVSHDENEKGVSEWMKVGKPQYAYSKKIGP